MENKNIRHFHASEKDTMYPMAGKYTEKDVKNSKYAKFEFDGVEHMWVLITSVHNGYVFGELANDPTMVPMKYGDLVKMSILEVEAVL